MEETLVQIQALANKPSVQGGFSILGMLAEWSIAPVC